MSISKRILFFAEAVTLAHVARPVALAKGLDPKCFEVILASDKRYQQFMEHGPWQILPLHSVDSQQFLRALAKGHPVYDVETLRNYVREDLELIKKIKPDLIVGDFRLSLSASARLAGIPYITITNAYWSPYYARDTFPLPVLPITKGLPLPVAHVLFRLAQRLAFHLHCEPLNRVRQENGLHSLGADLRHVYTDADYTLYADTPQLFPTKNLPANHRYLGPILWSPPVTKPKWWDTIPEDKPLIYLTLGSSGQKQLLPQVLAALANMPITIIAATAGTISKKYPTGNAYVTDYLPGTEAAARADLVICNGGSLTSQQALAGGVPVLGIGSNMDQLLNMEAIVEAGAGILLRADRINAERIRVAVTKMLSSTTYAERASKLMNPLGHNFAPERFSAVINEVVGDGVNRRYKSSSGSERPA